VVVCLFGPTGTGKTDLALQLATDFALEIVSVDSALVYRHMDIGTAKPSPLVRAVIPHHLIDIREPQETYSAGQFRADALEVIRQIHARGHVPLLVGGTMLYFRALLGGLAPLPGADARVRTAIDAQAAESGWAALHAELARVDPAAAERIRPTDRQRIQRALEVFRLTGRRLTELQQVSDTPTGVRFTEIALAVGDRDALRRSLERRLQLMLAAGFLGEVRRLMDLPGVSPACAAMRAVGYRQIWRHLAGETSLDEAIRQVLVATHRLAKRQLTWLRGQRTDLAVDWQSHDALARVSAVLDAEGVSRRSVRCNIMDAPRAYRDNGV